MVAGRVASSVVQRHVKYVQPVPARGASGLVAQVYEQVADEMRLVVPPALLHSPSPDVLAAYWALMREPLVADGGIDRGTKEALAAAVSVANICPYCAEMHTVGMYELSTEHDAEAIAADRVADIAEPRLREVIAWARSAHRVDVATPMPTDLRAGDRAELIGVVVAFHYLARMVNVFLSSFLLPPAAGPRTRRRLRHGLGRVLGPTLRGPREPGRSVQLLPAAELPDTGRWSVPAPTIATAVARSYRVFDAAGRRTLSTAVRDLVLTRLDAWQGEETGLRAAWCEDLIADLAGGERAAARLALLTALASHRVDAEVVGEFRRYHPEDRALVDAAAWASFAAAALIGQRQGAMTPAA
jgi:AhpD family alkylhydroperoxidase